MERARWGNGKGRSGTIPISTWEFSMDADRTGRAAGGNAGDGVLRGKLELASLQNADADVWAGD